MLIRTRTVVVGLDMDTVKAMHMLKRIVKRVVDRVMVCPVVKITTSGATHGKEKATVIQIVDTTTT